MGRLQPLRSRLVAVATPVFRSEARRRLVAGLVLLTVLLLAVNFLNVGNNYVTRDLMTALAQRQEARFYAKALTLVAIFAVSTIAAVYARFVEERLGLLWRYWLTRHFLDRYLGDRAYRRLVGRADVDNPDQRISEDIKTFTTSTLSLLILFFNAAVTIVTFSSVLGSITPWLFVAAVAYAVLGSFSAIGLGRSLVGLDNQQFRKEADFRYGLVRLREHAGSVAQMAGERDEKARLMLRLHALVANLRNIIFVNRNLGFFTNGYNYLTQIIPIAIVAPLYIKGRVEFGTVAQAAMAFTFTLSAFSLIVTQFQQLSSYAAVVNRLGALWEATTDTSPSRPDLPRKGLVVDVDPGTHRLAYEGVTLETPRERRLLVRDLSFELHEGQRLIVTGANGAGKTALFLATAGLWEGGRGRIVRPAAPHAMFLPQQPYAVGGKLRDHLLYGLKRDSIDDERVDDVLRLVGLKGVVERGGGLEAEGDWPNVLSEGELQRFALARLLLANPRFAFLDQAASVLDAASEQQLYEALSRSDISYMSVGDHPALFAYHDLRLELHGDGAWTLTQTERHSARVRR